MVMSLRDELIKIKTLVNFRKANCGAFGESEKFTIWNDDEGDGVVYNEITFL